MIEKCPQDRLQALANLAKRPEAFGEPEKWSKIEVNRLIVSLISPQCIVDFDFWPKIAKFVNEHIFAANAFNLHSVQSAQTN